MENKLILKSERAQQTSRPSPVVIFRRKAPTAAPFSTKGWSLLRHETTSCILCGYQWVGVPRTPVLSFPMGEPSTATAQV